MIYKFTTREIALASIFISEIFIFTPWAIDII